MKSETKNRLFAILVYLILTCGCLIFVSWIALMSYNNTCLELQEEYLAVHVKSNVNKIENSLNFGKELDKYYGMDELLMDICDSSEAGIDAIVVDKECNPIYVSMENDDAGVATLAAVYNEEYRNQIMDVSDRKHAGTKIKMGKMGSLVFPIFEDNSEPVGYMVIAYDEKELLNNRETDGFNFGSQAVTIVAYVLLIGIIITGFKFFVEPFADQKKWYIRNMLVIIVMAGMLGYIFYMSASFANLQEKVVTENAYMTANYIKDSIDELQGKGLLLADLSSVSNYINNMVVENRSIENIAVVKNFYDTTLTTYSISLPISNGDAFANIAINREYLDEKMQALKLVFGAVFVICLMITFEMTKVAEIITNKLELRKNKETSVGAVGNQIRILSFMTYTAIYTSMPYAAVIMREQHAKVFGFSESVSASLPLTVELLAVMLASLVIQKVYEGTKLSRMTYIVFPILILCNLACGFVNDPGLLIVLRALCGVGFAFLKYWLNSYVAAGSTNDKDIQANFAQLNGGLLGGITVGASLGAVMASAKGYQFNYIFTAVICLAVCVMAILLMPWKMIDAGRETSKGNENRKSLSFKEICENKNIVKALLLGDIPLNIGLMYVVSFLPVYMSSVGQSEVATSYAYLINGAAGVYLGVLMVRMLKRFTTFKGAVFALFMGAAGILVLVLGSNTGVILLSAAIMGLFDGYGTPTITGHFTGLPGTDNIDKASMLTIYSSVGSAVQIVCPLLYNVLIQPDGKTLYLGIFGICFAAAAFLFYLSLHKAEKTIS